MAATFHIKDTKEHFTFIPESIRDEVKIGFSVAIGLASLSLFLMLGQHLN